MLDSANIYKRLEEINANNMFGEEDWENSYSGVEIPALISKANSCFDLNDFLETKLSFVILNSSSGWNKRTYCPFHKNGSERTASFFVNPIKNIFHCQACGVHGGLVEYLSLLNNCSAEMAANHILSIYSETNSNSSVSDERKRISERKKITSFMLELSDLFREFIRTHKNDDDAYKYINKAMEGFDSLYALNKEKVEENIEEIVQNLKKFIKLYDEKVKQ